MTWVDVQRKAQLVENFPQAALLMSLSPADGAKWTYRRKRALRFTARRRAAFSANSGA